MFDFFRPPSGPRPAIGLASFAEECTQRNENSHPSPFCVGLRWGWFLRACFLISTGFVLAFAGCGGGAVSSTGGLEISPSTLSFGSVAIGKTATASVSLTNLSSSSIAISALSTSSKAFTVSAQNSLPITLAGGGGTYTLSVSFDPSVAGAASGQLTVTTNSAEYANEVVGLSGNGLTVAPALSSLTCSSNSIPDTGTDTCTVTLSGAAGSGGVLVDLTSSSSALSVPATVTVASGAASAGFTATASTVSASQSVMLTASEGSVSESTDVEVEVANPSLTLSAATLSFGNVNVGAQATPQTLTVTSTGAAAVTITGATVSGTGFNVSTPTFPVTLNPGSYTTFTVQFDPSIAGAIAGQLSITSDSSSSNAVSLSGTGVPVLTGLSCTDASMTGSGTDPCSVTLNAAAATGGFVVNLSSNNTALTVPSTVTVSSGSASGSFSASVSAVTTAQPVTLTATAGTVTETFGIELNAYVATLSINATSLAFGDVDLNSPTTQSLTLTSTGTAPVTVSTVTISGAGFSFSPSTFPLTLNSTTPTATLSVEFDPTTAGAVTGQLTVTSNSSTNGTANISLTGTGVTAYEVDLTWDAPSSSPDPVASYNIYRSPSGSSDYALMGSVTASELAYTDQNNIVDGQTYDYIVESVDAEGNESIPSNMASVMIP